MIRLLLTTAAFLPLSATAQEVIRLAPIIVQADEDAVIDGYRAVTTGSATRTQTPLMETPQSIQVIPQELLRDQGPISMAEALRNASGAQGNPVLQTPAFESTIIRGFPAEFYRDGITNYINTGDANALATVERIEVLKGPTGALYGGGIGSPMGGAINVVSKKPQASGFTELGLTYGSDAYAAPSFDINRRLSGTVLFRAAGSYVRSDADVDVVETERYSFSPSLTLGYGTPTRMTIDGYISKWSQQEYQGLPATGTVAGDFDIDRSLYIGDPDIPDSMTRTRKLTFTLDHDFNDTWSSKTQFRYGRNEVEQITQIIFGNTPDMGPTDWSLYNSYVPGQQKEYTFSSTVEGHLTTGEIEHTLLFGVDYARVEDYSLMWMDYAGSNDLANPGAWPAWTMPSTLAMGEGTGLYETAGAFAQIQSTLGNLRLLGGIRLAHLSTIYDSEGYNRKDTLNETRVLPRIGAVYDLTDTVSVFVGYSEGMRGNAFNFYASAPKPQYSKQAEVGVKFDTGTLSGSVAAFHIERENVPVVSPDDPLGLTMLTDGMQRSQGVEADVVWQPAERWKLIANYAYTAAELTRDIPNGAVAGSDLAGVPRHSGGLWVDYDTRVAGDDGWRIGSGIHAVSSVYIDAANDYRTPGYATLDASGTWTQNDLSVSLYVKNLTDRDYWVPMYGYLGGRVATGAERAVLLNVSKRF